MTEKIRLLFVSDYGDTGFGTVAKELCQRLALSGIFNVTQLAWNYNPNDTQAQAIANSVGYKLQATMFWEPRDQFGALSWSSVIDKHRPEIVLSLGDPWMVSHIGASEKRNQYTWISYMPIDRDIISKEWLSIMKQPDVLVLYSDFGMTIVEDQMPFRHPVLIKHGVDRIVFKPWRPIELKDKDFHELKSICKKATLGPTHQNKFIVGFMGRNQVRKDIPRVFSSFKAFNCKTWCERLDVSLVDDEGKEILNEPAEKYCNETQNFRCELCTAFKQREETKDSMLYLHTTGGISGDGQDRPGIGWRIDELVLRFNLHGRVMLTPGITALKGLSRDVLAQYISCWDVHLFLTHSEGFGLPVVESIACGIPTLVTDYSSMPEIVQGGGGDVVKVKDYSTFVTWENVWASADIGDAADKINKLFLDPNLREQWSKESQDNPALIDWATVAEEFIDLLITAAGNK